MADRREDSCLVIDADPVVSARHDLTHRHHADPVVEAERGPALDPAPDRSREVDQVTDDRRGGGPAASTLTDKEHLSDQVALDEDGILGSLDAGQWMVEGHQR